MSGAYTEVTHAAQGRVLWLWVASCHSWLHPRARTSVHNCLGCWVPHILWAQLCVHVWPCLRSILLVRVCNKLVSMPHLLQRTHASNQFHGPLALVLVGTGKCARVREARRRGSSGNIPRRCWQQQVPALHRHTHKHLAELCQPPPHHTWTRAFLFRTRPPASAGPTSASCCPSIAAGMSWEGGMQGLHQLMLAIGVCVVLAAAAHWPMVTACRLCGSEWMLVVLVRKELELMRLQLLAECSGPTVLG